jgi:hypothetical protein
MMMHNHFIKNCIDAAYNMYGAAGGGAVMRHYGTFWAQVEKFLNAC